jgi:hypothetical protein
MLEQSSLKSAAIFDKQPATEGRQILDMQYYAQQALLGRASGLTFKAAS